MLNINGKTFMNLQEAVQWLLDNNALPFQANVNYIANTEIAKSSIINPSPASIKVGALVLFADSKIGTVSAVSSNSFMVGSQYTDIKNALNFISNVSIDGSQHLIVTFSDGSTIDAGFLKQVSYFAIDASQHLIVYYNDNTSTDLGAIFSGNITISGDLTVSGDITGPKVDATLVTGDEIVEKMTGYSAVAQTVTGWTFETIYVGMCKTGNKLTIAIAFNATKTDAGASNNPSVYNLGIPSAVGSKLYPTLIGLYNLLDAKGIKGFGALNDYIDVPTFLSKAADTVLTFGIGDASNFVVNTKYYCRTEFTFLLNASLI